MSKSHRLCDCQKVSVCDLSGVERFVVWAIRWRASADQGKDGFAESRHAGRALQYLEILAHNLLNVGDHIDRWQADPAPAAAPSPQPA